MPKFIIGMDYHFEFHDTLGNKQHWRGASASTKGAFEFARMSALHETPSNWTIRIYESSSGKLVETLRGEAEAEDGAFDKVVQVILDRMGLCPTP